MERIIVDIIIGTIKDAIRDDDFIHINNKVYIKRGNLELFYDVDVDMVNSIKCKLEELDETERDY